MRNIGNRTLTSNFKLLLVLISFVMVGSTIALMAVGFFQMANKIAEENARLYNQELVSHLETHVLGEVVLSQKIAIEKDVQQFLLNETDLYYKAKALESVQEFFKLEANKTKTFFMASAQTGNMYWIDPSTSLDTFTPVGKLDASLEADQWFFNTLSDEVNYHLNIDLDRFINEMRVWINIKVVESQMGVPDKAIGVLGTGLELEPILSDVFGKRRSESDVLKTIIVNQFGAIQVDSDAYSIRENSYEPELDANYTLYKYHLDPDFVNAAEFYFKNAKEGIVVPIKKSPYDFVALSPISDTQWHVVTFFSTKALYEANAFLPTALFVLVMMIVLIVLVHTLFQKLWVKPLQALMKSLVAVDYQANLKIAGVDRSDEFGDLARTIQQLTERLVQTVPVGVFMLNSAFEITYANAYVLNQLGFDSLEQINQKIRQNPTQLLADADDITALNQLFSRNRKNYTAEVRLMSQKEDEPAFWAYLHILRVSQDVRGAVYEGLLINISNQKSYEDHLLTMATTDSLTGAMNRRAFDQYLEEEMRRSNRYDRPLSLLMFDLDHFKVVNDTYGHQQGDQVLIRTCQIVKDELRTGDKLCRWGGEEFIVVLAETDVAHAFQVAEKLRKSLEQHTHPGVGPVTASFSATQWSGLEPASQLFARLDRGLLRAKHEGRNRTYSHELASIIER